MPIDALVRLSRERNKPHCPGCETVFSQTVYDSSYQKWSDGRIYWVCPICYHYTYMQDSLDTMRGIDMPKLGTQLVEYPPQVDRDGVYEITQVKGPQQTRMGRQALIILVKGVDPKIEGPLSLFVPHGETASTRTNEGRLIIAFGDDTDHWIKKKVRVTLDEGGKRKVEAA